MIRTFGKGSSPSRRERRRLLVGAAIVLLFAGGRTACGQVITTVAGTGSAGYSGDGAAATAAQLTYPSGVAVDRAGNLYIADSSNQRIRKVTADVISTVAGTGNQGYSGDGGAATAAQLNNPIGVTEDSAGNQIGRASCRERVYTVV